MSQPQQRYQVVRQLGDVPGKGRATYLANDKATQQSVVLKQFLLAKIGSNWAGCEAYKSAIQGLMKLKFPGIPRYLGAFPLSEGFCTVQQYKKAQPLSQLKELEPEQIKQIAVGLLKILDYLQSQEPPVIHRNIKPENVLVDAQQNVYLVDFGFDFIGSRDKVQYSVAGTPGFMPREQSRDRGPLTVATDLFATGMTLACVLTQTPSTDIKTLSSQSGGLNLKNKVGKDISFQLVAWLEKMAQTYPKQRFSNAAEALTALNELEVTRSPEVVLRPDSIELEAEKYGDKLTASVKIINPTPDTLLQGQWSLAPHPSEPRGRSGSSTWIAFKPSRFQKNQIECEITVDFTFSWRSPVPRQSEGSGRSHLRTTACSERQHPRENPPGQLNPTNCPDRSQSSSPCAPGDCPSHFCPCWCDWRVLLF